MTRTPSVDPYLAGGYAPLTSEGERADLEVTGRLPAALAGRYLRTGPNPLGMPPTPYHWFTGDGMVHAITLNGARACSYRNRWVRTDSIADRLHEPRRPGPAQPLYDMSNTNIVAFAGRLLSLTEGCQPYLLDHDLDTIGRADFGTPLPHGLTAHPKIDPATGELHAFSSWWQEPCLLYHRFSADGQLTTTEAIDLAAPVTMHDFALTAGHVVFFDQPAVFDLDSLTSSGFPYRWNPDHGARIGLLPRAGTGDDVRWIDAPLGYSFHPLNAYETETELVVDVPLAASAFASPGFDSGAKGWLGLQRWTIDLARGRLTSELLDDLPQELCRVRDDRISRVHRYGYTIELGNNTPYEATRVFKHDLTARTRHEHDFGPGHHPGEFVFVPDPERPGDEDGGWLLGLVHHHDSDRTTLAVLDAQDLAQPPVAEVHIPQRIPFGFHGCWVPE